MAESKRVYEIRINGIQESYEGVKSLSEVLNGLSDVVVNVSNEEQKASETRKSTASSTDALAKAQEKLNNYDREYQEELAKVNAELSANKKEINEALKIQQAQDTVDAKQLDTYAQKQQYLSALNTLIRNHSTATEEDVQAIDKMVQESAQLQAELKATDEQMQIYVRNVGNYNEAADRVVDSHKSVKQELKDIKSEMAEMLANGVSKTDAAYLQLAERAGQLKDAIGDANADIKNFASDTQGMTNAINLASSAVNAYQLYNSTMELFGEGNEEAAESMRKMMAVMTVLNSLQQVQNSLLENGSATARLYNKAVELVQSALGIKKTAVEENIAVTEASTVADESNTIANELNAAANEANAVSEGVGTAAKEANTVATGTNSGALGTNTTALDANATASKGAATATNTMSVAQKAGAVASKTLSVAMKAIPLMAIISLVMALIQNWESIWNWFKKTFPILDTLSQKFNKFGGFMNTIKTGAKALGAAIVNWIINPFKTFADVIGKILEGDFKGAWQAAVDGINNQFKGTMDAFNNELEKGMAEGQEEMTAKAAEESNKRTQQELEELKIQERNNKTYSKKYIDLQQKDFDERKKMAKGNQEELNKIKLEEMQFYADVEDKKTAYANEQNKKRTKAAEKAANEAKKAAEEAKKAEEEAEKERQKLYQDTDKSIKDIEKTVAATDEKLRKLSDESYKDGVKKYAELTRLNGESVVEHLSLLSRLTGKIDEVNGIIQDALENGSEAEVEMLRKYILELEELTDYGTQQMLDAQEAVRKSINQTDYFVAKRREVAVNQIAIDAQKIKDQYETQIGELSNYVKKLEAMAAKQSGDKLEETNAKIEKANKAIDDAQKSLERELGTYATEEIEIPVNVNFDYVYKQFENYRKDLEAANKEIGFSFQDVIDAMLGVDGTLEKLYKRAKGKGSEETFQMFRDLATVIGLTREKTEEELAVMAEYFEQMADDRTFEEKKEEIHSFFNVASLDVSKFGTFTKTAIDKFKDVDKEMMKTLEDTYNGFVKQQDKIINFNDKAIKRLQEAAKGVKLEPVMEDDDLSKYISGQIMNIQKTEERYKKLREAYVEYQSILRPGSEERMKYEDAWQKKIAASLRQNELIKKMYGEQSEEYKNAVMDYELLLKEKEKADAAYALEYEKVTKQIEDIDKKSARIREDYFESLNKRMKELYSAVSENFFQPIADGFGSLLEYQLEELQDALDKVTELYDKAVDAREESAERLKQINDDLRNDDGQNKEALQQRLAEEEVLLVQREEAERALQKEKEKREKEVQKKELQQRKLELSQKLMEGIANVALGVTAALKYGFPLGPVFAAVIGAMGALQTAIIAKQLSKVSATKMEKGGKVGEQGVSRSHRQGGHRIEGTNIEVEGQEWVINRKSSQKYDTLLRAINEDNVGLVRKQIEVIRERRIVNNTNQIAKFATGGQINTLTATNAVKENNEIAAITELIKTIDFQPTVSVVDINKVNKRLVRVQDLSGKAV